MDTTLLHKFPIIIPFVSILSAELVKLAIDLINQRAEIRFIRTGGMPSGHSAFVGALVVVVAYREGLDSTAFMISAVLALVVMYDAVSIRSEAGKHAKLINHHHGHELDESLGHDHLQVIVGAVFGAFIAYLLLVL
jgi:hypothetical protein